THNKTTSQASQASAWPVTEIDSGIKPAQRRPGGERGERRSGAAGFAPRWLSALVVGVVLLAVVAVGAVLVRGGGGGTNAGEQEPSNPEEENAKEKKVKSDMTAKEMENSIGMKFVLIRAGKFTMGSSESERKAVLALLTEEKMPKWLEAEGPQHEVEITKPF